MKYLRKYNENVSDEFQLKDALQIYAEELPNIGDISIVPINAGLQYRITIDYINEVIVNVIRELIDVDTTTARLHVKSIQHDINIEVESAFSKFAKKYDMIYDTDSTKVRLSMFIDTVQLTQGPLNIRVDFILTKMSDNK